MVKPGIGIALDLELGVDDAMEVSKTESLDKSFTRVAVVVVEDTLEKGRDAELARDPSEENV